MPELTLHPDAATAFNVRADEIKIKLKPQPEPLRPKKSQGTNPHIPFAAHFDETNIIGEIKLSRTVEGKVVCREFNSGGRIIGLYEDDYRDVIRLAEALQSALRPRNVISVDTLEEIIFEWIKKQYRGEAVPHFAEFAIQESVKKVVVGEMWIPISHFHIPSPFRVGNVTFRLITKEFMDVYEAQVLTKAVNEKEREAIAKGFERKRSAIQGRGGAIVNVAAEPAQAYKNALEETERTLAALRFYSPFSMSPTQVCYSAPMDKLEMAGYRYMVLADGRVSVDVSGISDRNAQPWNIRREDLLINFKSGLNVLSALLCREKLTDFQETFFEALSMLSKATMAKEISDRLLYTLVALETLFVRDSSEPIQENLSVRMALMHDVSATERRSIVKNIKDVYALRSKLVHHGLDVRLDDIELLKTFTTNSWISMFMMIGSVAKNISRHDFFEELENRKVSG